DRSWFGSSGNDTYLEPTPWLFKRSAARCLERLAQVGKDVVDMLDADGQAHHVAWYAGLLQSLVAELAMGGGRRVAGQRLGIADIDQAHYQLQRVDEARAGLLPALNAEREDRRRLAAEIALRQVMFGV